VQPRLKGDLPLADSAGILLTEFSSSFMDEQAALTKASELAPRYISFDGSKPVQISKPRSWSTWCTPELWCTTDYSSW